jgi:hypothetical protein
VPNESADCKDRRGDAVGATPGCPFDSIDTISFSTMMKRSSASLEYYGIVKVTCIKISLVLHRLETELPIMIVTIVDLLFMR